MAIMKEENFPSIRVSQKLKDETIQAAEHEQENLSEYIRKAVERRNEQIMADNSGKRSGNIGGNTMLKEKIEKAIEKEAMKKGIMGTENCTVTLTLTDAEKEEFRNLDLDEKHYWWEIDENELTVTYTEELGMKEVLTMTAAEFATLNDIEVDEVQSYSDANVGAENLSSDTELKIIVQDGEIRVTRSDNPWNDPVDVVCGPAENWTYEK